jgi:hypothetical protein
VRGQHHYGTVSKKKETKGAIEARQVSQTAFCFSLFCVCFFWLCVCFFCLVQSFSLFRNRMKEKVMAPFRPPREGRGRDVKAQQFVHRKDNSRRFKELEKTMGRLLTAMQTKDTDEDSTDKGKGVPSPSKDKTTKSKPVKRAGRPRRQTQDQCSDSEEPTALGLVQCSRHVVELDDDGSNPWWPKESPEHATKSVPSTVENPSPNLAEFEALLDDLEQRASVITLTKSDVAFEATNSDNEDDDIPIVKLARARQPNCVGKEIVEPSDLPAVISDPKTTFVPETQNETATSDNEDDLLPLHELISQKKEMQFPNEASIEFPKGYACIGLRVARDFGPELGIFHGKVVSVDMEGRRHHYHIVYEDEDEEDYDFAELNYAVELQKAIANGTYAAQTYAEELTDGKGSVHVPSEDDSTQSSDEMGRKIVSRKRKSNAGISQETDSKSKRKKSKYHVGAAVKAAITVKHTTASVLHTYKEDTEYGRSFRVLTDSQQIAELKRLNRGANKGTTVAIKTKIIVEKYKHVCADKMREHLSKTRTQPALMFRATPPSRASLLQSPTFLSVGE